MRTALVSPTGGGLAGWNGVGSGGKRRGKPLLDPQTTQLSLTGQKGPSQACFRKGGVSPSQTPGQGGTPLDPTAGWVPHPTPRTGEVSPQTPREGWVFIRPPNG